MRDILRVRGLQAGTVLLILLLLAPTPVPQPLAGPIREAGLVLQNDRPLAALRGLETGLAFEPSLFSLHRAAAQAALAAGLPDKALAHLNHLEGIAPLDSQMSCLRCIAYQDLRQAESAAGCWRAAPEACLSDAVSLQRMEAAYRDVGDREGVLRVLERLSEVAPDDPGVSRRLGLLLATSDPERALPHLRRAAESGDPLCQSLIILLYSASAEGEPALVFARLGQTFMQAKEWDLAAAAFRQALAGRPDLHEVRAFLGLALDNAGIDGESELLAAASAAPHSPMPHLLLGMHFRATGQPQRALQQLELTAALDPDNPAVLAETAATYEALGDLVAARDAYRAAAEMARTDAHFWLLLAEFALSHEMEVEDLAIPAARNAATLEPGNAHALSALGYAHYLAGQPLLAERCLRRALDLTPLDARLQFRWGLLRQSQGDLPGALAALALAAELDPSGAIGLVARRTAERIASH